MADPENEVTAGLRRVDPSGPGSPGPGAGGASATTGRTDLPSTTGPSWPGSAHWRRRRWGAEPAARLASGHRLLTAGNGGNAVEAQHLTAELVGRFDTDRQPPSLALTGPAPNPLAAAVDEAICLPGRAATVNEAHLVAVHLICPALEAA